jgi:hypothetical protein
MEAEWPTTTPGWQRDVMLLLVAAVFVGEGLIASSTRSARALVLVGGLIALVAILRMLVRMGPHKPR